ncbi:MAG: hypothetical protein ACOY6E_08800 [Pseudomonadota bacterium]|jgi:predicted transcriptional regulator
MTNVKEAAKKLIDHLPDQATWDDVIYEMYVKQKIEMGLQAVREGRTIPHEQIEREFLGDES